MGKIKLLLYGNEFLSKHRNAMQTSVKKINKKKFWVIFVPLATSIFRGSHESCMLSYNLFAGAGTRCQGLEAWINSLPLLNGRERANPEPVVLASRHVEVEIQQWCMSFTWLPGMGARMLIVAQAFLGSCSFPWYASNAHWAQANIGILLLRKKQAFCGLLWMFSLVKHSKCGKK